MKTFSISGSLRGNVGKKGAKAVRRAGDIPCVLYGGKEQVLFSLNAKEFGKAVFTPEVYLMDLNIEGRKFQAIIQEIQWHPVTTEVSHLDFLEVVADKPIVMKLPLKFTGVAPGVLQGGKLFKKFRALKVKGLVEKMPESITLEISGLNVDQNTKVSDIKIDGLTMLDPQNAIVVGVASTRAVVADAAVAAAPAKK
ncbi:MAG: 50S ribosomal protein L25/general stress protein Ctc [Bacteroidetes bacterium GWE2_42_24]|nr:MAG: 50S ribosomal protein L25/general stress protein Ctc [Bacteroidetes bacterium GWE2_42_24]OFY25442.1 MAG: 50S ribosomal protein L25/general stress protein Ctc [Bacteroidetes bacterium GWF2_43_11]HCT84509.1 50S ribosomal protein L25 [Candidatus Margulisiibacteriota bacterium]